MQYRTGLLRILLGNELHSTRPVAASVVDAAIANAAQKSANRTLFIAQRVNRIELRSTRGRIKAGRETDKNGKHQPRNHKPPWYG